MDLVSEVHASFQKLTHRKVGKRHVSLLIRLAAADRRACAPPEDEARVSGWRALYALLPCGQPSGVQAAAGLTVVTNNEREFTRVPGLQLDVWEG